MAKSLMQRYLVGAVIISTLPSLIKTDSSKENSRFLIPLDHYSNSVPSVESIVDSRFNLLAANFQDQIDVLQNKVVRLENSNTIHTKKTQGQHKHGIQKRQTDKSKSKRPINFENINSSCTFFYPDYPDNPIKIKLSSSATNQSLKDSKSYMIEKTDIIRNETPKSKRPICEYSSSFCTFLHPDHPSVGRKNDKNSLTVGNENVHEAKNENGMATIYESTTDHNKADHKMSASSPKVSNEILHDHTGVKEMPTSCTDLQLLGHKLNGVYLIKTSQPHGRKLEAVYCDFQSTANGSVSQNLIGSVKTTTRNVFFYVQRNSSFYQPGSIIPFELERLNEGGAFDLNSGVFTAPVPGIYHFEFHGIKDDAYTYLDILLQVNGNTFASTTTARTSSFDTLSMSSTLRLKTNDQVNLFHYKNPNPANPGVLFDFGPLHFTHFSGWLMEEDLI